MMEFNDMVTVVDRQDIELRGIEVLIKMVPFIERDVEERCAELEEEVLEDCERMKEREWERVVRLREAILARAGRAFPELRITNYELRVKNSAASPQGEGKDFRPVSGGDAGGGSLTSRGGESATGFMTSQGGSCNRTEAP